MSNENGRDDDPKSVILVGFHENLSEDDIRRIIAEQGCSLRETGGILLANVVIVRVPPGKGKDQEMVERFKTLPEVSSASVNEQYS
jgi:hypothetical protein